MGELRDYVEWHRDYDDPDSALSLRLRCVQAQVDAALHRTAPRPVRVLSACAGDGRDLLEVLARREDRARVSGTLIEIHPVLAARAAAAADALGAGSRIAVRQADAGTSDAYAGAVPADLVLLSGIMGNISPTDIERLVRASPQLCAPAATLIWTRGAMEPDLGPSIRGWFAEAGFEELACIEQIEGTPMRVGVVRYAAAPVPLRAGQQLFTFLR